MSMTTIESLAQEMGGKFGLGSAAQPLMRELLRLMTGGPGGIGGFLDRFRSAGLGKEVSSFVGGGNTAALPAKGVESALGASTVAGIAERVGLKPAVAGAALGFGIPKVIGLLTPGGKVPTVLPDNVQAFVRSTEQVSPTAMATVHEDEQVRPLEVAKVRMDRPQAAIPETRSNTLWLWPLLGLIALGALLWWAFLPKRVAVPRVAAVHTHVVHVAAAPRIHVQTPTVPVPALNRTLNSTVLNFAPASAVLPPASAPALQSAAATIKGMPTNSLIQIAGHTDNTGNADTNMNLSQRRAEAVRDALVQDGVNPGMLTARGFGDTQPIASNDTAQGRQRNRRIEFTTSGVTHSL